MTQQKFEKIRDLLIDFATAIKVEQALTLLNELQEELKPKAVDVGKLAYIIDSYVEHYSHGNEVAIAKAVIAEIERQKNAARA